MAPEINPRWWDLMAVRMRMTGYAVGARHARRMWGNATVGRSIARLTLDALETDHENTERNRLIDLLGPQLPILTRTPRTGRLNSFRDGLYVVLTYCRRTLVIHGIATYAELPAPAAMPDTERSQLLDVYLEGVTDGWRNTLTSLMSETEQPK